MNKSVFGKDVKDRLLKGTDLLFNSVSPTMGPYGRNVLIEDYAGDPHLTKDGVTVAKFVESNDNIENMAIKVIRQAALETAKKAGDGTTTSIVLARQMFYVASEHVKNGGNPIFIYREMRNALNPIFDMLYTYRKEIELGSSDVYNIANISANGDAMIADTVADAFTKAGVGGRVDVEESQLDEDKVTSTSGLTYRHDPITRKIFKDVSMRLTINKASIMVVNEDIKSEDDIVSLAELADRVVAGTEHMKGIIFIRSVSDNMIEKLTNIMVSRSGVIFVKLEGFGERKTDTAFDIAAYTNASVATFNSGAISLGEADEIELTTELCSIKRYEDSPSVEEHVKSLKEQLKETDDEFLKGKIEERIAKLTGSIVTIYVGGKSETEVKERKDRYDDAVSAVRSALSQGVLPGGGNTLLGIYNKLISNCDVDDTRGFDVVCNALLAPIYMLLVNKGVDPLTVSDNLKDVDLDKGLYYDLMSGAVIPELVDKGIIDPLLVTKTALENAVSVAGNLLTTEVVITNNDKV